MSILILRNNQQTGPYPEDQARQMLATGQVAVTDLAWKNGMAEWKPLGEILSLAGVAAAPVAAATAMSPIKMAALAGGAVVLLGLGGVGYWQHNEQQRIQAEQQQLAMERQRMHEEQARAAEQLRLQEEQRQREAEQHRLEEEKHKADEERQRLAEEKRELERKLQAERAEKERQRRQYAEQQRQHQQRAPSTFGTAPPDAQANSYPGYGGYPQQNQALCRECGVVQSIRAIQTQADASGGGAVLGGVIGGVLGNQVGHGKGKTAATVLGALGGAMAGNQIEKSQRSRNTYEITVRFDDGLIRTFNQENQPPFGQGQRVRMVNGTLAAY